MLVLIPATFSGTLLLAFVGIGLSGLRQGFVYTATAYTKLCLACVTEIFSIWNLLRLRTARLLSQLHRSFGFLSLGIRRSGNSETGGAKGLDRMLDIQIRVRRLRCDSGDYSADCRRGAA